MAAQSRNANAAALLRRASRSDAVLFAVFFLWVFLWLDNWADAPYHWDAVGYVGPHTMDVYSGDMLPILRGEQDVGHPTLVYWLHAASWHVFGPGPVGPHLVHFLFGALYLLYVFKTCRLYAGAGPALGASLLSFFQPLIASQTLLLTLDLPMAALFAAALYYALRGGRPVRLALFSTALVLSKLPAFLLLGALGCALLAAQGRGRGLTLKRRAGALGPLFAAFGVLLLFGLVRYLVTGTILYRFHADQLEADWSTAAVWSAAKRVFVLFRSYLGLAPLAWIVVAGAAVHPWARRTQAAAAPRRKAGFPPLAAALAGLVVFYLIPNLIRSLDPILPRYLMVFFPALLPCLALALRSLFRVDRFAAWAAVLVVGGVLLCRWRPEYPRRAVLPRIERLLVYDAPARGDRSGETNLQWTDYVHCLKKAGAYLDAHLPAEATVMATYPFDECLRNPYLGYVERACRVRAQYALDGAVEMLQKGEAAVWAYSSLSHEGFTVEDVRALLPLVEIGRWEKGGQYAVLYAPAASPLADQP